MAKFEEYAPGVRIEGEADYGFWYVGRSPALVACGLVRQEWLPGEAGNGKTSQRVAFNQDGSARSIPPMGRMASQDMEFGYMRIQKSGALFRVLNALPATEIESRKAAAKAKAEQETWNLAKEAHRIQACQNAGRKAFYITLSKRIG